ncbi:rhamnose transport system permease protein [Cryobacterium flavum]|uniref:Autoinducer 2 import system permease protein LsrD n=1 Tax=Cryobacterium flavum TaxID=1424659 RepID=A0A4R8VGA3_9MICO|nr:ABC transporter permease [Cryobacterium flavum]TFB82271.1 ABC transporter permease [Cryobacterium flavum]SDN94805.1 rhamnose transport system permease protein [Cryobacterium flavum]
MSADTATITTNAVGHAAAQYRRHSRTLWRRMLLRTETAIVLAIILLIIFAITTVPYFAQPYTYLTMILNSAPILLMLLPVTLIIITGDIDLSVGSVVGFSSAIFGLSFHAGIPLPLAAGVAVVGGGLVGLLNGVLVTVVGLPSLAVTIGTLALFRGIAVGLLGTTAITGFPSEVTQFIGAPLFVGAPAPMVTVAIIVVAIGFAVVLHLTPFGRGVFAIGLSSETAAFSGVRVNRTRLILFVLSGLVASATGVYYTLQYSNAIGTNGLGFELQVVTAIVLGGVSIWGGRGSILGALAGGVLIATLNKTLQLAGIGSDTISIVTGATLIFSVVVAGIAGFISRRRRSKASVIAAGVEKHRAIPNPKSVPSNH